MYLLSKIIRARGQNVKTLCLKRGFIASLMEKILFLLIYDKSQLYPLYPYPLERLLRGAREKFKKVVHLWYAINTFELCARILLLLIMNKICRLTLLIEDYIPVMIADYAYVALKLGIPIDKISKHINILIHLYFKAYPSKVVLLTASTRELIQRWYKRGRAECSRTYLLILQRTVPKLAKILTHRCDVGEIALDTTNKTVSDTLRALVQNIRYLRH
ncbi:MAG: hypothetical protein DRO40_04360 [Thermoprotei archaeon]|nr:MAG: hypothetical protein DRO40_04360 [Thermoprotei archaeon]